MELALETPPPAERTAPTRIEGSSPGCTLKRPRETDDHVVRAAAEELAKRCAKWDPTSKPEDWTECLVDARHDWEDGYKLARRLEDRAHVIPDSDLVDVLDDAAHLLSRTHEAEVRRWVSIVGFEPAFEVGDEVACRHGEGIIHSIRVETAQYVVSTDGRTNGGYVMAAEDVRSREARDPN